MTVMRELATQFANSYAVSAPLWRAGVAILGAMLVLFTGGAASLLAILLLAAGVLLRAQNRVTGASAAFAAMITFQPMTAAIFIYFALRGDWRTARWTLSLFAVALVTAFLLAWPITDIAKGWRTAVETVVSTSFVAPAADQSIYAMLAQSSFVAPPMALAITLAAAVAIVGLHLGRTGDEDDEMEVRPAPARLLLECAIVLALTISFGPLGAADQALIGVAGLGAAAIIGAERLTASSKLSVYWIVAAGAWLASIVFVMVLTLVPLAGGGLILFVAAAASSVALWRERKMAAAENLIPKLPFGKRRAGAPAGGDAQSSLRNFLCSPLATRASTNT
jgi:hypothetical protein